MKIASCPICGGPLPLVNAALPFCSSRCKQIDLARWLDERYTVPVERPEEDDDAPPSQPPPDEA